MNTDNLFVPHQEFNSLLMIDHWIRKYPWLIAGFTTRQGGISQDYYHSFNLGLHVDDDPEHVISNRKKLLQLVDFTEDQWVSANQTHSDHLYHVGKNDGGKGLHSLETALDDVDGLYTTDDDKLLTSFYADCVPLFFLDPGLRLIGVAHAGWKGTVAEIGPKLIRRWEEQFGSRVEDIQVVIGPSIGGCCYEVNDAVISHIPEQFRVEPVVIAKENGKYMLDLKKCNANFLEKAGVPQQNIEISSWCTSCHQHLFFSHRKEQGRTGRMVAFIGQKGGKK